MTPTQQFIEDAIAGGWTQDYQSVPAGGSVKIQVGYIKYIVPSKLLPKHQQPTFRMGRLSDALLDPLAWQAVGKTRGWTETNEVSQIWLYNWHCFIRALADGKTIDEALAAIK
jgi:hypothetical protein